MKPKPRQHLFIVLLAFAFVFAGAQDQQQTSFSLQQAIEYAMKNSPAFKSAALEEQSADHKRKEVAGMGLPQLDASFDSKYYISIPVMAVPAKFFDPNAPDDQFGTAQFGTKYNTTAGLSASQLIFSSDYIFGLKAAKGYMNLARIQVASSKSDLTASVSKAYYSVLVTRDRIKLLESAISRLKKSLDEMKAFNEQGLIEVIDVERIEVQYNNLQTELDNATRISEVSEMALKFHMGFPIREPIVLSDKLDLNNQEFQEIPTSNLNVNQRADIQTLRASQALLDIDVQRNKWGYLPTIAAYGSYQFNRMGNKYNIFDNDVSQNVLNQWFKIALVGVTVNLNLFDGMQRHHRIQQTKITALKNTLTLQNLQMAAEMESMAAAISYNNSYRSLVSQKRNMELAEHVFDVAQKKFREGVGSNLEVFTAETSLKESQTNYYVAVYNMILARIDYEKATGAYNKN